MPEGSYSAHRSLNGSSDRKSFTIATVTILCALVLAVTLLRFYRLSVLPRGINSGEAANAMDALDVLQGDHAVSFRKRLKAAKAWSFTQWPCPSLYWGEPSWPSVWPLSLASTGTVFLVFWLGLVLFGKDPTVGGPLLGGGLLIGGVGAVS